MSRICFYKLTVDDGGAPCIADGLLSLAICKPMLRTSSQEDDILVGFAANRLHRDNRLIYIARLSRPVEQGMYYKDTRYFSRPDCIYEWRNGRFKVRNGARYHGSEMDLLHDLGKFPNFPRARVLLSRNFCYFGKSGTSDYKKDFPEVGRAVERLGQGHRVNHRRTLEDELSRLVAKYCPAKGARVLGEISQAARCGVSHRGGGSEVCGNAPTC